MFSHGEQTRVANKYHLQPQVGQGTCKHLKGRTWLVGPISWSSGFPHPVYSCRSRKGLMLPPPTRARRRGLDSMRLPPWKCFPSARVAHGWWDSLQNDAEIKSWEEAHSSGSDPWLGLQGVLSSSCPWGWITKSLNDLSLSNFLLLLEGPLCRRPAPVWSSPLLSQIKKAQWKEVKGLAEVK